MWDVDTTGSTCAIQAESLALQAVPLQSLLWEGGASSLWDSGSNQMETEQAGCTYFFVRKYLQPVLAAYGEIMVGGGRGPHLLRTLSGRENYLKN